MIAASTNYLKSVRNSEGKNRDFPGFFELFFETPKIKRHETAVKLTKPL
jgi:hypothetical protein